VYRNPTLTISPTTSWSFRAIQVFTEVPVVLDIKARKEVGDGRLHGERDGGGQNGRGRQDGGDVQLEDDPQHGHREEDVDERGEQVPEEGGDLPLHPVVEIDVHEEVRHEVRETQQHDELLQVAQERPEARNSLGLRLGEEKDEAQQGDLDRRGDFVGGHPPLEERVCEEDGEEKQQDDGKEDDVGNREIADVHQGGVAAQDP
jgi:hypothetical protein